jgi:hypothetical protein
LGIPYTCGIAGRLGLGSFEPDATVWCGDRRSADLRGVFFAGIGTLKLGAMRSVKKK